MYKRIINNLQSQMKATSVLHNEEARNQRGFTKFLDMGNSFSPLYPKSLQAAGVAGQFGGGVLESARTGF